MLSELTKLVPTHLKVEEAWTAGDRLRGKPFTFTAFEPEYHYLKHAIVLIDVGT